MKAVPHSRNVVFTVGNELRGDDAVGPLLAQMLEDNPITGWEVIDGSSVPENHVHAVRRFSPERVLVVDAADMGLAPGEVRRVKEGDVARQFLMSTHSLPLSFLLAELKESVPCVDFLGVQPRDTSFMAPVTPQVQEAVARLYAWLRHGGDINHFAPCIDEPVPGGAVRDTAQER
jgi:hydrogenase 3 maturation protease